MRHSFRRVVCKSEEGVGGAGSRTLGGLLRTPGGRVELRGMAFHSPVVLAMQRIREPKPNRKQNYRQGVDFPVWKTAGFLLILHAGLVQGGWGTGEVGNVMMWALDGGCTGMLRGIPWPRASARDCKEGNTKNTGTHLTRMAQKPLFSGVEESGARSELAAGPASESEAAAGPTALAFYFEVHPRHRQCWM
jgi:hypothetical protein